jgi:hypothetical protein
MKEIDPNGMWQYSYQTDQSMHDVTVDGHRRSSSENYPNMSTNQRERKQKNTS